MNNNSKNFEKAKSLFLEGLNFFNQNNYQSAEEQFLKSLEIFPNRISTLKNLISIYILTKKKNKLKDIIKKYENLKNDNEFIFAKAYSYFFSGLYDDSIKLCKILINNQYEKNSTYDLLVLNYKKKKLFLDILNIYKKKLKEKKDYEIYYNIGCLFDELGKTSQAIYYFKKSRFYKEYYNSNLWNLSLCYLKEGKLDLGFSLYEYRWLKKNNPPIKKFTHIKSPKFIKELKNKKILISDEQGLGDTLQFSRFVIDLLQYTTKITFVVNTKLKNILTTLHEKIKIVDYHNLSENNFDYHISLCSIPKILGVKSVQDINFYPLNINNQKKSINNDEKIKVGLCWSGNKEYFFDDYRSIAFSNFKKILEIKSINFYKLSQNIRHDEFLDYNSSSNLTDFGSKSLFEISQILNQLDLVVSSDTSIIHLAGILNINSILLLNYNSDWRWFNDTKKTIWYPSVSIIKQNEFNSWASVFEELEIKLKNLVI